MSPRRFYRSLLSSAILATVLLPAVGSADPFPLRSPQVPFDYTLLQEFFNAVDPQFNVATDQTYLPTWGHPSDTDFELITRSNLSPTTAAGFYDAGTPAALFPHLLEVFPAGTRVGALAHIHRTTSLVVTLFDPRGTLQSITVYPVHTDSLGFYIQKDAPSTDSTWFSEDGRNGSSPQMLTYTIGVLPGYVWLCWEPEKYSPSSTFSHLIIDFEPVLPTATAPTTWGRVKSLYR